MIMSDCLLGPAFEIEAEVLHFLSKRLHSLQHGRLKTPHFLDVELVTQGFF